MASDYRKFTIEMRPRTGRYRLWQHGADQAVCVLETYREKRSVYFAAGNLLPSTALQEAGKEYRLILLGAEAGTLVHQDFGPIRVGPGGAGAFFQKFGGPALSCYTHCLLVAADSAQDEPETVLAGETPFGRVTDRGAEAVPGGDGGSLAAWHTLFAKYTAQTPAPVFSREADETGADWWRVEDEAGLPEALRPCAAGIRAHGHYVIGQSDTRRFVGVPGRFLLAEQPMRETGLFRLWQPMRGGEAYFADLTQLSGAMAERLFGYWIGEIDGQTGAIRAF